MHTDTCVATGYAHPRQGEPCQDYAEANPLSDGGAYAIVSDGCSGGGLTDFGSRHLGRATAEAIEAHWATHHNPDPNSAIFEITAEQRARTTAAAAPIGLKTNDMLATCVYAYLGPHGGYALVSGDGLIAQLLADGRIVVDKFEWNQNTPCYLAYADDNFASFIDFHGGDLEAPALAAERWLIEPEATPELLENRAISLGDGIRGPYIELATEETKAIAVFTDGVCQVDDVAWQYVIARLFAFKSLAGKFAVRRLNRFLEEVRKHGNGPIDDLSYAVILTEQEVNQ